MVVGDEDEDVDGDAIWLVGDEDADAEGDEEDDAEGDAIWLVGDEDADAEGDAEGEAEGEAEAEGVGVYEYVIVKGDGSA